MKKIVTVLLLIIIISCDDISQQSNSLIDYIPRDSQIIIKINDLEGATSKLRDNDFIKKNKSLEFFKYFKDLSVLDKKNQTEGLLCFSPLGKNDFEYTYISKFNPSLIHKDSLPSKKVETISYSSRTIYKITSNDQIFFATKKDSVLIASSSQLLIENAIRMQTAPLPIDKDLQKVYDVSGTENTLSLLLNGKKLQNIHNTLLPNTDLKPLHNFSGWISADATIEQSAIYLDGIAIEKDSLSSTIGIFDNTLPQENKISKVTPVTAKGFISYTYNDYDVLKKNLSKAQDRDLEDIPTDLNDILSNVSEIGMIFLEKENILVLNAIDIETIKENLEENKAESYRNISIYKYDNPSSFSNILNPLIKNFDAKYYFIKDEFIFFGSTMDSLRDVIANILNQTLLFNQEYYKTTIKDLSSESSILITGSVKNIKQYIAKNVEADHTEQWKNLKDDEYQIGVLQIIKENDFAHIHCILQKNRAKGSATSVIQTASTTLEDKILKKPILVKNHRTKGMDIAVQDVKNNLYLISDVGSIYWKKQIDGEILGDIQQIDIYKNGRYQLLFNTSSTLYLVDRDGKDVKPYPKKFEKLITQPLALFDYDKNKRYRILITQGNTVTMYNAEADIVKGFRFKATEADLILPPKHIRIGSKDYILLPEKNGKLTILDRLGRTRINVKEKINFSKNEWYPYLEKLTSTTKTGELIQVQNDGSFVKQNLNLQEENLIVATNKTLVTLSENKLTIKGKTLELDFGVYTEPKLYFINNKIYITITDIQAKKVYLYDSNGELFPNFPVYGNSVLSMGNIDKDSNIEFVVQGEENSVLIYQIN
ncbi:hypothetical protein [Aquimarina muelleri]|uniref:Uncharacterized protein n=1 Tax=Aquimarina muelleri TaxID=279356 RepID=A0A918N0U7_9FLAO|nr:hypothetical protein [Aquimarina muelleri]MCX2762679.1 ribonuclease HII [Aquimarina muelleri]GGX05539.1 hypothetical protein GCM10007384_04050 [Aquimarina muelleri]